MKVSGQPQSLVTLCSESLLPTDKDAGWIIVPVWILWRKCRCFDHTEIRTPDHLAHRLVTVLLNTLFRLMWCQVVLQKFLFSQLFFPADGRNWLLWDIVCCRFVCLFVYPFRHTCYIGHINYRSQFIYYNITYNIWKSTQYNTINNNKKFKDKLYNCKWWPTKCKSFG